jgi:excisionase family DNA binding protein
MDRQKRIEPAPPEQKRLFTIREAAVYMALSETTLYHWISRGKIRPTRLAKKAVRLDRRVLDRMIEQMTEKTWKEVRTDGSLSARRDMVAGIFS